MANPTVAEQVEIVLRVLKDMTPGRGSPVYQRSLAWIASKELQGLGEYKRRQLIDAVCKCFELREEELFVLIGGVLPNNTVATTSALITSGESELEAGLPRGGWFEWYTEYTRCTESPLSFHIFSSLVTLGAAIGRRAWIDMGFYRLYPNYCAVLIGPTGRVKKTSAVNIARGIIDQCALAPVMADKPTPEALASALKECGQQFIYAPEFSVFFGKAKYNEGLTTLVIRLLDCPDKFDIRTMGRGTETVENVALSILGGSTPSLLSTGTPAEVTSSGFLNRFMLIVENDTHREYPTPTKGSELLEGKIHESAKRMKTFIGAFTKRPDAEEFWISWYGQRRKLLRAVSDEVTAEVLERSPDHLLRTALLIHAVQCDDMRICLRCMQAAKFLLDYTEKRIPSLITSIAKGKAEQDGDFVLSSLRRLGGAVDHSNLLRRVSHRMDAARFKRHIATLVESNRIREEIRGVLRFYIIVEGD